MAVFTFPLLPSACNTSTNGYIDHDTTLTIESFSDYTAGKKTILRLEQGALLVDGMNVIVNTPTGQSAESVGKLMGVRDQFNIIQHQVDCLEGLCMVTKATNTIPEPILEEQAITSTGWLKSEADCSFWQDLAPKRVEFEATLSAELTPTPTTIASETITSTKRSVPVQ